MRLWHIDLLPKISTQRLLGQHRECCAMRGMGWGKKHSVVDYVWRYDYQYLWEYHLMVIFELEKRCINIDSKWKRMGYRGKKLGYVDSYLDLPNWTFHIPEFERYPEHNETYYNECVALLRQKGEDL
jgi:uncharacterized protein (TIGR02328 family)